MNSLRRLGWLAAASASCAQPVALPPAPVEATQRVQPAPTVAPPPEAPHHEEPPYAISRADDILAYSGPLDDDGLAALKAQDEGIRALMIRSPGGDSDTGMRFGEWVLARGLAVVVEDHCMSSCANYVFTAGRVRLIVDGGVVAWHGSVRSANLYQIDAAIAKLGLGPEAAAKKRQQTRSWLEGLSGRQDIFFASIGVDECVTRIGNVALGVAGFFTMSVRDMARFGLTVAHGPASAKDIPAKVLQDLGVTFVTVGDEFDVATGCD